MILDEYQADHDTQSSEKTEEYDFGNDISPETALLVNVDHFVRVGGAGRVACCRVGVPMLYHHFFFF